MVLLDIANALSDAVDALSFEEPAIACIYNPLRYAMTPHAEYLRKYGTGRKRVVLVGMNPGPWGMVQTGIPFGDVSMVKNWLGIDEQVHSPQRIHPKRPVTGFSCTRSEVSGTRLWGWAKARFGTPERFFEHYFVHNYCPLAFMEESGKNLTPDKLTQASKRALFECCDHALASTVRALAPAHVIGIGAFAETRALQALKGIDIKVGRILHPSPASPLANANWAQTVDQQLADQLG
ncbi:MAG: single-stranded DNA-binding protein [Myxococcales bacterium]|nr:single-stranded DNA-binding protein [Myxococcales bacterium]